VDQTRDTSTPSGQAEPLLTTKLYVPRPRRHRIVRSRLLQQLDDGVRANGDGFARKLTLVSAPAGYGKTTLLAEWVARMERPVAWLSLDEGDDDPVRFLAYLTAALRRLPQIPPSADLPTAAASGETVLTVLLNQVADLRKPVILVLDDVHRIGAPAVHDLLTFLVDNLPPTLHLVIATRADPPLPIARLRARGHLTEIRQADLRFTHAEASRFLREAMALDLAADDAAVLADRTEGWIAGLQMAAVSMQQRTDLKDFVRAFAGSHRYVMDYLLEEVLERRSEETQTFLLQTSILERLNAPLCDAVCDPAPHGGSQSVLEHLERTNLFVTPLDDGRRWYRYHRLFADLLRRHLAQRWPDLVPGLHRRASTWYEEQGLVAESIEHALTAANRVTGDRLADDWVADGRVADDQSTGDRVADGRVAGDPGTGAQSARDFERAATLIEGVAEGLMMRSELMTLRNWLDALPEPVLFERPRLCAYHAWLLLLGGESIRAVESRIGALRDHPDAASGQTDAVRAVIAVSQGRIDAVPALTERALETLTEDDGFWYSVAQWLRDVLQVSGDDPHAEDAAPLRRLVRTQLDSQNVLLAVIGLSNLGELRFKQGRLREAEEVFTRALDRATDVGGQRLPIAGEPLIWLGELARERNDLPAAEGYLVEGIERVCEWGPVAAMDGYLALARLRHAQGDAAGAIEAIEEAERLAVMFDATEMDDHMVAVCRARLAALEGDFRAVERWAEWRGLDSLDPDNLQLDATVELHLRKYELAVLGLAQIREGRPGDALPFLEPALSHVTSRGRWGLGIEMLALQAAAYSLLGQTAEALARLERALARAEPEGYVRLFVEMGEPMARLLYEAAQRGVFAEYAGRLLAAFPEPVEPATTPQQSQAMIEPLSERELEVLAAIAEGLSNQEAAQSLYISERTVKWHASNIYGKLQVSSRTEAVARARALGILPR